MGIEEEDSNTMNTNVPGVANNKEATGSPVSQGDGKTTSKPGTSGAQKPIDGHRTQGGQNPTIRPGTSGDKITRKPEIPANKTPSQKQLPPGTGVHATKQR